MLRRHRVLRCGDGLPFGGLRAVGEGNDIRAVKSGRAVRRTLVLAAKGGGEKVGFDRATEVGGRVPASNPAHP